MVIDRADGCAHFLDPLAGGADGIAALRASAFQHPCRLLLLLPYGRARIEAAGWVGGKLGDDRRGPFHELGRLLAGGEGGLVAGRRRCDLKRALVSQVGKASCWERGLV